MPPTTAPTGQVLLADDEPAFQRLGRAFLEAQGHRVTVAGDAEAALAAAAEAPPDVVLLDLAMPPHLSPEQGLALIPRFAPALVIVITGHGEHAHALRAAELGAWDFMVKPVEPELLRFVVGRAVAKARLDAELRQLRQQDAADDLGLIGQTQAMQQLRALLRRVAPTPMSVLVLGPTGTGKELVARALHACSPRSGAPFVVIHCGALPAELLESELFGHLKGSFTGAWRDQPGLLEAAHRGTLFLDEVGEMPLPMQVKLLRFLQEGCYLPVGSRQPRQADVRVVAATHRNLEAMVQDGSFREDLFYRLKGVVMRTPGLAERRADIPALALRFLRRAAPRARLAPEALAWLAAREWPGNVRELRALVESAGALALPGEDQIGLDLLRLAAGEPVALAEAHPSAHPGAHPGANPGGASAHPGSGPPAAGGLLDAALAELEQRLIRDAMSAAGGNQSEAARRLGISRVGLIKKLTRWGWR